jgi:peptidyl-tRNA hydrolase, PTH2 family
MEKESLMSSINREIKQVIVMRNDLNMRKGKMCAQAAHASIHALLDSVLYDVGPSKLMVEWLTQGMTKICVRVDSEEQLLEVYQQAKAANLEVHLITDAGLTEFKEPTKTCLSIGPDRADKINKVTGDLKLL